MKSIKNTARFAGLLYLFVFLLGMFGELFVRQDIIVPGDAGLTATNLLASESMFRFSLVTDLVRQVLLVLLPLVLFKLFRPVSKNLAVVTAAFALVTVPIAMFNILFQFAALLPLSAADYLSTFPGDQLQSQVMYFLELSQQGTYIAQLLGFWVSLLGILVFNSGFTPRILGILLVITGLGYLADAVIFLLYPGLNVTISLYTFWGEALFALWLLIMGVNEEKWEKRAQEAT